MVKWLAFLLRIREIPSWILAPEIYYCQEVYHDYPQTLHLSDRKGQRLIRIGAKLEVLLLKV
jgi:hypothetical protein